MDVQVVNPDWRRQKAVRLTCEFCGFGPITHIPGPYGNGLEDWRQIHAEDCPASLTEKEVNG